MRHPMKPSFRRDQVARVVVVSGLVALLVTLRRRIFRQQVVVPAFFPLGPDWAAIEQAGNSVSIVVPEHSFSTVDPLANPKLLEEARKQFARCRRAGQKVLGYVSTMSGQRNIADIEDDIKNWYSRYFEYIDGIFFDEGPQFDDTTKPFYDKVIGDFRMNHPGQVVLLNAAQFPNEWVVRLADYVILWEESQNAYIHQYVALVPGGLTIPPPAWWTNPKWSNRIVHIVHSTPTTNDMRAVIKLSKTRRAKHIYVYDGTSASYGNLPAYWGDLLNAADCMRNWLTKFNCG